MKKIVLLSIIIGFAFSTMAQNQMVSVKNQKRVLDGQEVAIERTQKVPTPEFKQGEAAEYASRIWVGKAGHQRGLRREEAHIVSYNYDMDVIGVTNILDPETYDFVDELGIVGMWYSADKGETWNGPVVLNDSIDQGANYYISGALFNPEGNTNVENMFGVYQGALNPISGSDWQYKGFGSSTLAGEYQTNYLFEGEEFSGYWNFFGLNQVGNEMRCLNLKVDGTWANFTNMKLVFITGEFTGEAFDWDFSNVIDANLYVTSDSTIAWIGMYEGMDSGAEIAWADDGMIGYAWVVGVSNEDATGYQPVVFRTVDAGESWDYIFLDFFDGDMQDILEPYLIECSSGLLIPHVFESAGVVDYYGNLQMMVAMGSTSADVITYPDSLGYHWEYPGDLFNLVMDEDGISELMWVDSLRTENVLSDTPGNYCETEGWQHRISAATSENKKYTFFTWIDTRDINETYNLKPDLFGWEKFLNWPILYPYCLSKDSELEEEFYFNFGSDKAYYIDGTFILHLPYLQSVTPLEFLINTSTTQDPITLSYVTEIQFPVIENIEYFTSANAAYVTQNTPNPFNGSTTIEVSTKTASLVTVEVSNIMGQLIYTVDAGIVIGTQKIELSSKDLETGIYLYTVNVGNESVTKKMIVE